jgi:hypothetical protein
MMAAAIGEKYTDTMRAVVRACWNANMERKAMHKWFLQAGESHRRSRLRGWRAWYVFCRGRRIDLAALRPGQGLEQLYASFLVWMDQPGHVKKHVKKDAPPAVQELFDLLKVGVKLNENAVLRSIRRNIALHPVRVHVPGPGDAALAGAGRPCRCGVHSLYPVPPYRTDKDGRSAGKDTAL